MDYIQEYSQNFEVTLAKQFQELMKYNYKLPDFEYKIK